MKGPNADKFFDPTYFTFELVQAHYTKVSYGAGYIRTATPIEYEFWGDKFPHVSKSLYEKIGLTTYLCPK